MVAKVSGRKARFCCDACRSGFAADRKAGAIYGPHQVNGRWCLDREEWSLAVLACAYCMYVVAGRVPETLQTKFAVDVKGELK